jgi:hypothetical protein
MNFLFELFGIHINEQTTCHGFKWQNVNVCLWFDIFLVCWIVITPKMFIHVFINNKPNEVFFKHIKDKTSRNDVIKVR